MPVCGVNLFFTGVPDIPDAETTSDCLATVLTPPILSFAA